MDYKQAFDNVVKFIELMVTPDVKFKKLNREAITPRYNHEDDACMDLFTPRDIHINHEETIIVPTDIAIELPVGFEARVRGRSGLSSKGIHVHHGTIDEGYRGNIGVVMTNNTGMSIDIEAGKAIAQLSVNPVYKVHLTQVEEFESITERDIKGFGSSDAVH